MSTPKIFNNFLNLERVFVFCVTQHKKMWLFILLAFAESKKCNDNCYSYALNITGSFKSRNPGVMSTGHLLPRPFTIATIHNLVVADLGSRYLRSSFRRPWWKFWHMNHLSLFLEQTNRNFICAYVNPRHTDFHFIKSGSQWTEWTYTTHYLCGRVRHLSIMHPTDLYHLFPNFTLHFCVSVV